MAYGLHAEKGHSITPRKLCLLGKLTRANIPKTSKPKTRALFELVHSDFCGPIKKLLKAEARRFVTLIDDASKWVAVYPTRAKSDVSESFRKYLFAFERQIECKINFFQNDGGGEYISTKFQSSLTKGGIDSRHSCTYTPQQNRIAERMDRTLIEMTRTMLYEKHTPNEIWADAVVFTAYIKIRLTYRGIPADTTPHEIQYKRHSNMSHLRIFESHYFDRLQKDF